MSSMAVLYLLWLYVLWPRLQLIFDGGGAEQAEITLDRVIHALEPLLLRVGVGVRG